MIDQMKYGLTNKRILISGVSGQVGVALTKRLLDQGAYVIGIDKKISDYISKLSIDLGERLRVYSVDITQKKDVHNFFAQLDAIQIDHLINNAGVSVFTPFWDRSEEEFNLVLNVNLKGTFYVLREFLNHIKTSTVGHRSQSVVNIASHYGLISPDYRIYTDCERVNSEVYGASKAGVIQLTKYFAVNAADLGVRVNCVSPGGILNDDNPQGEDFQRQYSFRCPMGRMANVDEVVGGILFMMSPDASYINGHNLVIDGGMTSW
jgi:NAD(P)-dependent dehydrogenase (short-subunit alcohol dehydrogenase family)